MSLVENLRRRFARPPEPVRVALEGAGDPDERILAVRTLLAEETRIGMMVGVAVGWELRNELYRQTEDD